MDAALAALDRERLAEAEEAELGHRVVRLAEVAVDARGRGGHDHAAVAGLAHVGPRGMGDREAALDVDLVDQVPVRLGHLVEADVAEDAGVVHHDVDAPVGVHRGLDDLRAVGDRVVVGDGLAAGFLDLVHHHVGRLRAAAAAVDVAAEVVDHDLGAAAGEEVRVGPAEAVASAGHHHHSIVETQFATHAVSFVSPSPGRRSSPAPNNTREADHTRGGARSTKNE